MTPITRPKSPREAGRGPVAAKRIPGPAWPAILALALVLAAPRPPAAAADATTAKVDKLFAAWDTTASPGAALAVIRDGKIVYERGYGLAKLEDGLVNTPDKVFDIGSVSKQFTAACVALLVREGRVRPDDDIRKYLPEMPAYERPITVGHLLHHTSGLRDYNALLDLAGFRADADSPTVEEALEIVRRQKKLNYAPGEEYSYTNTGFFLLSQIVERATGRSLNDFAQERIFRPLGMAKTLFQDDHTQVIKDRATGYTRGRDGTFRICLSNWDETGDGNVYTTVRDLARWDQAFYDGSLGRDITDMLQTTGRLNSGQAIDYAWGLVVGEYKGLRVVEHGGAWVGFRAALVRFPEQRFSVIILANLDSIDPSGLAFRVADLYLADLLKEPAKDTAAAAAPAGPGMPADAMAALAGNWQDDRFGLWLTLAVTDGKLKAGLGGRTYTLAQAGPRTFSAGNGRGPTVVFPLPEAGRPATARLTFGGDAEYRLAKAAPARPLSRADLETYSGTYVSRELLDARYIVKAEGEGLVLGTRTTPRAELKAMAPDKFTVPGQGLNVEFVRGRGGRPSGFTVSVGRAAGIAFAKIEKGR